MSTVHTSPINTDRCSDFAFDDPMSTHFRQGVGDVAPHQRGQPVALALLVLQYCKEERVHLITTVNKLSTYRRGGMNTILQPVLPSQTLLHLQLFVSAPAG